MDYWSEWVSIYWLSIVQWFSIFRTVNGEDSGFADSSSDQVLGDARVVRLVAELRFPENEMSLLGGSKEIDWRRRYLVSHRLADRNRRPRRRRRRRRLERRTVLQPGYPRSRHSQRRNASQFRALAGLDRQRVRRRQEVLLQVCRADQTIINLSALNEIR